VPERDLRILQVSIADSCGGAEKVAWDMFQAYRAGGHKSWLAVGKKHGKDPDVYRVANDRRGTLFKLWSGLYFPVWRAVYHWLRGHQSRGTPVAWRITPILAELAWSQSEVDRIGGEYDFRFPGSWRLLDLPPEPPTIIHCHNLHSNYFDLRALPSLCREVPLVLSLHDAWLLSGLCHHSLDCERWKTGCGRCPQLGLYHGSSRDASRLNWRRKARIYAQCRLNVTTPCHWLMQKVNQSILAPGLRQARIIPNGIDLTVFRPGDREAARAKLAIPPGARVLLFVGRKMKANPSKDYDTMRKAVQLIGERQPGQCLVLLACGEEAPAERFGNTEIRFSVFSADHGDAMVYYQAADVYVHAAKAETFPLSVLEALACGTPVVASAVGGIPEQIKSLGPVPEEPDWKGYGVEEATGALVRPKDPEALATAIMRLLGDESLRQRLANNATRDARQRFDVREQVAAYLEWYAELLQHPAVR
jgi:glycosyltransferase involved in cell wall biosynthesis